MIQPVCTGFVVGTRPDGTRIATIRSMPSGGATGQRSSGAGTGIANGPTSREGGKE